MKRRNEMIDRNPTTEGVNYLSSSSKLTLLVGFAEDQIQNKLSVLIISHALELLLLEFIFKL